MAPTINPELLKLATLMGIEVKPDTFEDELRKLVLASRVLPQWMLDRANTEGFPIPRNPTYGNVLAKLGEAIVRKGVYRAGMVVEIDGAPVKIIGMIYGGRVVVCDATEKRGIWETVAGTTRDIYVIELDDAPILYNPPIV